jgi:LuxR family quorum sensing-dependent transcriptional regulator
MEGAASKAAIGLLFQDFAINLGFSYSACTRLPDGGESLQSGFILNSYPETWVRQYCEENYLKADPLVQEISLAQRPFFWSEALQRRHMTPFDKRIMGERASAGMTEGFIVPVYQVSGYTGVVSYAGREPRADRESRSALAMASMFLYNKLSVLHRKEERRRLDLTDRELECLRWAAVGKSDWEIGQILLISAKTVNYHIENAKRKFGVATRIQAILAAVRPGHIAF